MKSIVFDGDFPITSPYGWRTDPISGKRLFHDGIDVAMPIGTLLRAREDGAVRFAGKDSYGGLYIQIKMADGRGYWYLHLSSFLVKAGQKVVKGQNVAYSGNSGNSTGPHTHFGLQADAEVWNSSLDPTEFFSLDSTEMGFEKGNKIKFTGVQHIRSGSGIKNPSGGEFQILRDSNVGEVATIKDGPRIADGYTWYDCVFGNGSTGWVADVGKFVLDDNPVQDPVIPPEQTECEKQIERLMAENAKLKKELGTCKEQLEAKVEEISNLEEQIKAFDSLIEEINKNVDDLQKKYDTLYIEKNRIENEKNKAIEGYNALKNGRFMWIVGFLEKLFPKRE